MFCAEWERRELKFSHHEPNRFFVGMRAPSSNIGHRSVNKYIRRIMGYYREKYLSKIYLYIVFVFVLTGVDSLALKEINVAITNSREREIFYSIYKKERCLFKLTNTRFTCLHLVGITNQGNYKPTTEYSVKLAQVVIEAKQGFFK